MRNFRSLSNVQLRMLILFLAAAIVAVFALIGATSSSVAIPGLLRTHAQQVQLSGEWTLSSTRQPGDVQLNLSRRSERGGYSMNGETMHIADLQGLNLDVKTVGKQTVSFRLVREAGTITCEGYVEGGRGAGLWTFAPSGSFASAMESRGFGKLNDEELLRAAMKNLTTKYADDLKSTGYKLNWDDLNRASNHDISLDYIRELRAAGLGDLSMDDMIRASNHDISAEYIRKVRDMGFDKLPLNDLIRLANHDITPEFVGEMRSNFGEALSMEQLISLQNHDVDAQFISDLKAEGYSNVTPQQAINLRNHDVDRDFIKKAKAQGYPNATLEELVRLSSRGVIKD